MTSEDLTTVAEQSAFQRTGRFAEAERLCAAFAARWPQAVRRIEFGRTPEGRPLLALLITNAAKPEAREIRGRRIPVLMLQACIHPGEPDGKDAGFMVLRDILAGALLPGALERIAILFVPVFNADGHERFGPWNRVNQNGPQEMGWRTTAQNLNLNRDYTKADSPEMQAMLRLINEWDPLLCADLHVSDGADFEHDVSVQVEPIHYGPSELHPAGLDLRNRVIASLRAKGSLPLHFYYSLAKPDDPSGGFADWVYSPRFSTGYWPLRNRFTVLVETHSWKPYATRVRVTANILVSLIELTATHGPGWLDLAHGADRRAATIAGTRVTVDYRLSDRATWIDVRGYAYSRSPSGISGAMMVSYDATTPQIWHVPLRDQVEPCVVVPAPEWGYLIPAAYAKEIGGRLGRHGVEIEVVEGSAVRLGHESFRATAHSFDRESLRGTHEIERQRLLGSRGDRVRGGLRVRAHPSPEPLSSWLFSSRRRRIRSLRGDFSMPASSTKGVHGGLCGRAGRPHHAGRGSRDCGGIRAPAVRRCRLRRRSRGKTRFLLPAPRLVGSAIRTLPGGARHALATIVFYCAPMPAPSQHPPEFLDALTAILGRPGLRIGEEVGLLDPGTNPGNLRAGLMARPADAAEAARVLALCAGAGVGVVPQMRSPASCLRGPTAFLSPGTRPSNQYAAINSHQPARP